MNYLNVGIRIPPDSIVFTWFMGEMQVSQIVNLKISQDFQWFQKQELPVPKNPSVRRKHSFFNK